MVHILFKQGIPVPGYIKVMENYLGYNVGRIEDIYYDSRVDFLELKAIVIPEDIAPGFKFTDIYKDYIKMRQNSAVIDDFPFLQSSENPDDKVSYTLTDDDKALGVAFNKFVMNKFIEDRFTQKLRELQVNASELESATWRQQVKEAENYLVDNTYSTPLIEALIDGTSFNKTEYANKIKSRESDYFTKLAGMLKSQRAIERRVKECTSIADCHRLRHEKFGFSVSWQQQTDESIDKTPLTSKPDF